MITPFSPEHCSVQPPLELFEARDRLREANLDSDWFRAVAIPKLEKFSQTARKHPTPADRLYSLWSLCLQSEIHDLLADYSAALKAISSPGVELQKELDNGTLDHSQKPLFRQKMWALIFYSHCLYRSDDLERAKDLLRKIRAEVNRSVPRVGSTEGEPSFGLRARIAYSLGQVNRQLSNVAEAREEFLLAMELTRKRLIRKTEKYRDDDVTVTREQKYANYVTGKILCFGHAWVSASSGELQRARAAAVAGCTLLETSKDAVHRAYAKLIYAQILQAASRSVRAGEELPEDLDEACKILADLSRDNGSPLDGVPRFLARAKFEMGRSLFLIGHYEKAEALARRSYEDEPKGSRWNLAAGVNLIRILLRTGRGEEAFVISDELLRGLSDSTPRTLNAEVRLISASVLMEKDGADFADILKLINESEELLLQNPLGLATCRLHRARCLGLQGNLDAARRELLEWRSSAGKFEHGFIHELAELVEEEIQNKDPRFNALPDELEGAEKYYGVEKRLKRWAIGALYGKYGKDYMKDPNPMNYLGVTSGTIRNWKTETKFDPTRSSRKYH